MRTTIAARPWVAVVRSCGALLLLIALMLPTWLQAEASVGPTTAPSWAGEADSLADDLGLHDGGECGEAETPEALVDCGSELEARLDEPLAIAILRRLEVRTTKEQCQELLTDIWEQESCTAQGRECGKLLPGAGPGPTPKLGSSSASGQTLVACLEVDPAQARRLARPADERMPKLRDRTPPVPPPRLAAR